MRFAMQAKLGAVGQDIETGHYNWTMTITMNGSLR